MIVCNDPRVSHFCAERIGYGAITDLANIGWERDGKIVSGVVYTDYNGCSITAGIATDAPLVKSFLWAIFDYPFRQAGAKRMTATVEADNSASHNLVKRLGFQHEAVMKDAGRHGDLHVYRLFRHECRWLELKQ